MNGKMRLKACAMFLLFCAGAAAGTGYSSKISVNMERINDNFVVTIRNVSDENIAVNKDFSIDPLVGAIHFYINENHVSHELIGQINAVPIGKGSYINLDPGKVYGATFNIRHIEKMYGVKSGCYTISVYYFDRYANEFSAIKDRVSSKALNVCSK